MMMRWLCVLAFFAVVLLVDGRVEAQDGPGDTAEADGSGADEDGDPGVMRDEEMSDEAARGHFDVGQALFRAGRYEDAAREFEEAYALSPRSSLLFNAYLAYRDAGDVENAVRVLHLFLHAEPDDPDYETLEVRLHALELTLERQRLEEQAASQHAEHDAALAAAERARLEAETARLAEETEQLRRENEMHGPWWVMGSGGALIIGSAIAGGIALSRKKNLEESCPNNVCPPDFELGEAEDEVRSAAIAADILLFSGIATVGAGLVWYFIDKNRGEEARPVSATGGCSHLGCAVEVEVSF